jgi:hypothetical protein
MQCTQLPFQAWASERELALALDPSMQAQERVSEADLMQRNLHRASVAAFSGM